MRLFEGNKPVIGMLHVPALPGSPNHRLGMQDIGFWVMRDAEALARAGVDAMILENYGDAPFYPGRVPPHTVACLTVLGHKVKRRFGLPLGINVLRNDGYSAMAIAAAIGAEFVRVNIFTGARLTDQGIIQGEAHEIMRYRRLLGSSVAIFADVAVKHSSPLAPRTLEEEVADAVERAGADAVIVTGSGTGKPTDLADLRAVRAAAGDTPVLAGSGATAADLPGILQYADGVIVGTALKQDGITSNPVDGERVKGLVEAMAALRG